MYVWAADNIEVTINDNIIVRILQKSMHELLNAKMQTATTREFGNACRHRSPESRGQRDPAARRVVVDHGF